jgi:hypothetical protein
VTQRTPHAVEIVNNDSFVGIFMSSVVHANSA